MSNPNIDRDLKPNILEILDANRTMAVATIRPDGWPQATIVGYVHDDLTLYFATARGSQKFANLVREPRLSIAIGGHGKTDGDLRGLSMAARAAEVMDLDEVARLNALIASRYPEQAVFAPRGASVALMRASPEIISVVDPASGLPQPLLLKVDVETRVSLSAPAGDPPYVGPSWTHG